MNWTETAPTGVIAARGSPAANDDLAAPESRPVGWNPYEIWLTRVREPRDRAGYAASGGQAT